MKVRALLGAALLLISAHPPAGPTRDDVLRCYFITHPGGEPFEVEQPPELNRGRNRFL